MSKAKQTVNTVLLNALTLDENFKIRNDSDRSVLEMCGWKARHQEEKDRLASGGKRQIDHENPNLNFKFL